MVGGTHIALGGVAVDDNKARGGELCHLHMVPSASPKLQLRPAKLHRGPVDLGHLIGNTPQPTRTAYTLQTAFVRLPSDWGTLGPFLGCQSLSTGSRPSLPKTNPLGGPHLGNHLWASASPVQDYTDIWPEGEQRCPALGSSSCRCLSRVHEDSWVSDLRPDPLKAGRGWASDRSGSARPRCGRCPSLFWRGPPQR